MHTCKYKRSIHGTIPTRKCQDQSVSYIPRPRQCSRDLMSDRSIVYLLEFRISATERFLSIRRSGYFCVYWHVRIFFSAAFCHIFNLLEEIWTSIRSFSTVIMFVVIIVPLENRSLFAHSSYNRYMFLKHFKTRTKFYFIDRERNMLNSFHTWCYHTTTLNSSFNRAFGLFSIMPYLVYR